MKKHKRKCEECNSVFETYGVVGTNTRYCSRKCYLKNNTGEKNPNWRGGKPVKKCPVCGISFRKYNRKSCSKKCGNILKSRNSKSTNLGKTKHDTPHLMKMSIERKGKKRSKEICKNISRATMIWFKRTNFSAKYRYKKHNMRSNWERLFARFLDFNEIKWKYEPTKFYLKKINTWYLPDFYIPEWDTYVEVKGYMGDRSLKKITAFKKEYGNLVVVDEKVMKRFGLI